MCEWVFRSFQQPFKFREYVTLFFISERISFLVRSVTSWARYLMSLGGEIKLDDKRNLLPVVQKFVNIIII